MAKIVMPGLLKSYIGRFAPNDNAHDPSFEGWLRVCTNAYVLTRLQASLKDGVASSILHPAADDAPRELEKGTA